MKSKIFVPAIASLILLAFIACAFIACGETSEPKTDFAPVATGQDIPGATPQDKPGASSELDEVIAPVLRIDYAERFTEADLEDKTVIKRGGGEEKIIILSDKDIFQVAVYGIIYNGDENKFYIDKEIFSASPLSNNFYIEYSTYASENIPTEIIGVKSDMANPTIFYGFSYSGKDGSLFIVDLTELVENNGY